MADRTLESRDALSPAEQSEWSQGSTDLPSIGKISAVPLATLLPKLGELGELVKFKTHFEQRLRMLQDHSQEDQGEFERSKLRSEETMILQVLQWLAPR